MQSLTSIAPWSFDEQPDVVVNFFDADRLAGKDGAELIFLLPEQMPLP